MKITIDEMEINDAPFILEVENNTAIWKVSHTIKAYTQKEIELFIVKNLLDGLSAEQKRWIIKMKGIPVGCIDLFDYSEQNKRAGVGIVIHPDFQNKGIAKKAMEIFIHKCKNQLKLHQLYCTIIKDNIFSIKLFEFMGFEPTGIRKDWTFYKDNFYDEVFYQLTL